MIAVPSHSIPQCYQQHATTNTNARSHATSHRNRDFALNLVENPGIKFGGEVSDNRFLSNHTRTTDKKEERGPHNLQLIREQKTGQSLKIIWFCIIYTYFIS